MAHSTISRKEIAKLSGLSVRHLSRLGEKIPGTKRGGGGYHKWTHYDTPELRRWMEREKWRIEAGEVRKALPQTAGARMGVVTPHSVLLSWKHFRSAIDPAKYTAEIAAEVREVLHTVYTEIREFCAQLKK